MIGVGKLGQDCAEVMAEHYDVIGYDVVTRSPSFPMKYTIQEAVSDRDIIFIAAPTAHDPIYGGETPTSHLPNKDFDYSVVIDILTEVNQHVKKNQLVVLISTVLPGTVRNLLRPCITNARFIYNPYLIAMGTTKWDMVNPEMIIIGSEDGSLTDDVQELVDFYREFMQNSPRYELGTWDEAESIKIFYNTFISTKLALVNMIQDVAQTNGYINSDVVTGALTRSTQRIMGPQYMKAGMGDGGACHPRDNIALRYLAERLDLGYDLFDAIMTAREVQAENMAKFCLKYGTKVTIVGKAYKPGVPYTNGSSSLLVGYYIEQLGGTVNYYDLNTDDLDLKIDWTQVYLIGYLEDYIMNIIFPENSTVIDPWRTLKLNRNVIHYGNTRSINTIVSSAYETSNYFLDQLLSVWSELKPYENNIYVIYAGPISGREFERRSNYDIIDEIISALDSGKNKIVFYNFSESMMSSSILKAQLIVNCMMNRHNASNFFYVTAAIDGESAYDEFLEINGWHNKMNIMSCNSFEKIVKNHYYQMKIANCTINDYQVKLKDKKFLCFNRIPRESRLELISELIKLNLLKDSYCSFGTVENEWLNDIDSLYCSTEAKQCIKDNQSIFPLRLNISEERPNPTEVTNEDLQYFNNSYFSVITETVYYKNRKDSSLMTVENSRYITEKTYKSMLVKHPFILVSYPKTLKFLRECGYKTFSPYIDESYDEIEDDNLRLKTIVSEIERLCKMSDDQWITWQNNIKDIVEHNHTVLLNKLDFKITTDVENLFKEDNIGF